MGLREGSREEEGTSEKGERGKRKLLRRGNKEEGTSEGLGGGGGGGSRKKL